MGVVEAEIAIYETEDHIVVSTQYCDEDFVSFEFDLGGEIPAIEFEETKLIDKELGLLSRSERVYTFSIN
jgi:hypothetical protein